MFPSRHHALPAALGLALVGLASPAAAQIDAERLSIHGYLTQAAAASTDHPVVGIPADFTTDYRAAALQVRYALTSQDAFVVQLSHRRLGVSPLTEALPDVALGWAYYQRQLGNGSLKLGRAPLPLGIFNETRYVGTLMPLYRAPVTAYGEGFEALDGAVLTQRAALGAGWGLEASAYAGGFTNEDAYWVRIPTGPTTTTIVSGTQKSRLEPTFGGRLWIETPVPGLRVGGDALQFSTRDVRDGEGNVVTEGQSFTATNVAFEASYVRGSLRGEFRSVDAGRAYSYDGYYGQGVLNATERVAFVAQLEFADNAYAADGTRERTQEYRDAAIGVRYALHPGVVFKLEAHDTKGIRYFDRYVDPAGPRLETRAAIASVSVAF